MTAQRTPLPIRRVLCSPLLPFAALWLFLTVCHLFFKMGTGDDVFYAQVIPNQGLISYLIWAYHNWSARTLIDIGMCVNNYLPQLYWRLANPAVITLCAFAITRILGAGRQLATCWLVCGFMLLYPWQVMDSAGWVTTTAVFLWPGAAALLCLVPTTALLRGRRPHPALCALAVAGTLYAANMELILVVLLPLLAALALWFLLRRQRVHWLLWGQLAACLANVAWILLCPGPGARFIGEVTSWFPNYAMKSLFSKLELGISHTLGAVLFSRDFIFFFFCILVAWLIFLRHKNILYRLLGLYPLVVCSVFGMYQKYTLQLLPGLSFFTDAVYGEGTIALSNASSPAAYLPMLVLYSAFAVCLVNLYLALGHTPLTLAAVLTVGCGALSRVAMGFTPTVWTSGIRTGFFFSLSLIVASGLVFRQVMAAGAGLAPPGRVARWQRVAFFILFAAYCLLQMYSIQEIRIASGY